MHIHFSCGFSVECKSLHCEFSQILCWNGNRFFNIVDDDDDEDDVILWFDLTILFLDSDTVVVVLVCVQMLLSCRR